jgi:predicted dehydrogenase
MNRRDFLHTAALTSALAAIQPRAFAVAGDKPLRVATIGCGWYGKTDLFHFIQVASVDVVGLCDVDSTMAAGAADLVAQRQPSKKKPPIYGDYRKLLAEQKPDVVNIATPDHWHALPMIAAVEAGADVYCQKPISVDVAEGQAMVAAAKRTGRTVQVGLQRRSTPHLIEARDRYIKSGKLGKVAFVDVHSYYGGPGGFPPKETPPANLDWEMYVGPAPWLDFHPRIHPRSWRDFRNFSNGQIGDLCVHFFDVVRYFLDLDWPTSISADGGVMIRSKDSIASIPDTQTAMFDFPGVQVVWTQRNWGEPADPEYPWGATLYGDKGTLKLSVQSYDFKPHGDGSAEHGDYLDERDKFPEDAQHKETEMFAAPATRRHMQDFLAARQENRLPVSNIEQGHISSASCILANLSMDLGRSLKWDAAAGKIVGDDEANERLARPYRAPWTHPMA